MGRVVKNCGYTKCPISVLVTTKEKVDRLLLAKRLSLTRLAHEIGERKQTIAYRLEKPDAARDETFWPRIAAKLGVSVNTLLDNDEELPAWAMGEAGPTQSRLPVSNDLLEFLMDTIQNPSETAERKEVAKSTIRMWLRDFLS